MTVHIPPHQDWHDDIPGECDCAPAWRERGFVDDDCYWHRMEDVIQTLKDHKWEILPVIPYFTRVPTSNDLDSPPPVKWASEK